MTDNGYNGIMITERQEKILNYLIKEYLDSALPVSSGYLKEKCKLNLSPATIRNEFQELTEEGYIKQLYTSGGRIPTDKAYRHFVRKVFSDDGAIFPSFILKEIEETKRRIYNELHLAEELAKSLQELSLALDFNHIEEDILLDALKIIGPYKITYNKNVSLINDLIRKLEKF